MTKRKPPAVGSGTHVTFDLDEHEAGLTLNPELPGADYRLKLGLTNIVHAYDALVVGPSRRDALEHARARQVWAGDIKQYDHLYDADVRWETPVVVWATPRLHDRLNLWRTCSWLRERGIPRREVLVIDLPPSPRGPGAAPRSEPFECRGSVFHHTYAALQAHLAAARPWSRRRYDQAVKLWEDYVDPDPRHFARRCLRGIEGFPDVGPTWAFFSRFFPRMGAERTLRLSRYDELLLTGGLSAEWKTPVKVWRHIHELSDPSWELMSCAGDVYMTHRLAAWASHDAGSAVERAPSTQPDHHSRMLSSVYRLTERGVELRAGLPQLADAPRLPIGGAEAYAPETPWVLLDDGRLVRM
jgi:hypothetical protein